MNGLSAPDTKGGRMQRECLARLQAHEAQGRDGLPTSVRFIYYELVKDGVVAKHDPANSGQRSDQPVAKAIFQLRLLGLIPWDWIVDETRELTTYRSAASIADYLQETVGRARINPWDDEPPMIITESRSLGGVLNRVGYEYLVPIAPTNGMVGGFLRTDVAPALVSYQKVLYLGDFDWQGTQIESNTRTVLEDLVGPLDWERVALTAEQVEQHNLTRIRKADRRYKPVRHHDAVECEALEQALIVRLVRERLDALLPEPLVQVRRREKRQRKKVEAALRALAS